MFHDKSILIIGGTGPFGDKFVGVLLASHHPRKLVLSDRPEPKRVTCAIVEVYA